MVDDTSNAILQGLIEKGIIPAEKVSEVRAEVQKGVQDMYTLLVVGGLVEEDVYVQARAAVLALPYVDLRDLEIPAEVLEIIPETTARGHEIIAYEKTDQVLKVAMADPSDRQIIEFIRKKVDMPIEVALTSSAGVRSAMVRYQVTLEAELQGLIEQMRSTLPKDGELSKIAENLPVINITDAILKHAILNGASDIHIEPMEKKVIVRYRVDGILRDMLVLPKTIIAGIVARIKVLGRLQIDEHRLPQDGRFKVERDDYKVAFRVSVLPVFDGEKVVMRLLDETGHGLDLNEIGFSERGLEIFRRNITSPHGLVLVTGPTGSGKTTTLYAGMREISTPEVNISTIEDPIEYRMPRVNQTQVRPKIGLTFSNGLRALVRQDPDVIMVGEVRDEETAALAVNAALTGHLVLSTLHTNSAAGAIPRLVDMNVEPFLLASTTNLLVAQRLVRKLCEDCRKEIKIDKVILGSIADVVDVDAMLALLQKIGVVEGKKTWDTMSVFTAESCNKCHDGYRGRVGIYEFLEVTPAIQKLITKNVTSKELEVSAREEQNMVSMLEEGIVKVAQGITSIEEVLRVARE